MVLLAIVAGDADFRATVSDVLVEEGFSVSELDAGRGVELIRRLRVLRPDLVLFDLAPMRRGDWEEFLRAKEADPEVASIPILAMTSIRPVPQLESVAAVIPKPFDLDELIACVERCISGQARASGSHG